MAAITLVTGKPRIGKTAYVVDLLVNDDAYKGRKLFSNINGLEIEHHQPPEGHSWEDMHDWLKWPENVGSVVAYDEVQNLFPARSNGSKMSDNVLFLNVHGHYAIDIFFITQGTKIIDINLRETVNKHIHIARNKMGSLTKLEWNYCATNPLSEARNALSSTYKVNEQILDLYKSAEAHTDNKPVKSRWFYVIVAMLVILPVILGLIGFMSYRMYRDYQAKTQVEVSNDVSAASEPYSDGADVLTGSVGQLGTHVYQGAQPQTSLTPVMFVTTLAERPESKPLYDGVRQVHNYERVAACIKGGKSGCTCYSDQATPLREISAELCADYAENGLPFDPFRQPREDNPPSVSADSAPAVGAQVSVLDGQPQKNLAYSDDAPRSAQYP